MLREAGEVGAAAPGLGWDMASMACTASTASPGAARPRGRDGGGGGGAAGRGEHCPVSLLAPRVVSRKQNSVCAESGRSGEIPVPFAPGQLGQRSRQKSQKGQNGQHSVARRGTRAGISISMSSRPRAVDRAPPRCGHATRGGGNTNADSNYFCLSPPLPLSLLGAANGGDIVSRGASRAVGIP